MKKPTIQYLRAAAIGLAAVCAASFAQANSLACNPDYQPGMLAYIAQMTTRARPAPACAYQGDYMVDRGPAYDGPAAVAPQPTYAPTRTAAGYPYVHGQYRTEPAPVVQTEPVRKRIVRRATVKRVVVKRTKRPVVNVKNDLPPRKGKVQIVHARAEVRIYGPERMDIRLYRR